MRIEDALGVAAQEAVDSGRGAPLREAIAVVGNIEEHHDGRVRVYPDPFDFSRYVIVDPAEIDGDVVDVTDAARQNYASRRGPVFSLPVGKGATIEIVKVTRVEITDVAKLRRLSLDQSGGCGASASSSSGGCGCGCDGDGAGKSHAEPIGCHIGECITVGGETYVCWETWGDLRLCSGCCQIVAAE